jgi:long-chain acyl-CoA synthetase
VGDVLERYGVRAQAQLRPERVAFVFGDRRITYRELDEAIAGASGALHRRGVGPGARLGIALRNRPEWMVAALGAARLGAEVVPIPHGATADERAYFCEDGEVVYLLDEAALADFTADAAQPLPDDLPAPRPDYVTLRPYTSGTTGRPKAVLRPAPDAEASIAGMVRYYESYGIGAADEVNLSASPLHHLAGFSGPHGALIVGHTCVLMDHFDASEAIARMQSERVTYWWCAPVHLYRLTRLPDDVKASADLSSFKRVLHGSAPCAESLKREVMALFPPGVVFETYGGTETMGTVISAEEWLERPGSVGRPAVGSTIKIFDDDGNELPPGETGLIYIGSDYGRGFRYSGPAELTESVYRGELATLGDVGYVDDAGYLYVVDRRKDMVITGGANVYPAEVESVLAEHPAVGEVAVIGVPDDEYGELVVAIVVPVADVTPDELITFAREHLVAYKCPRRVELVDELPRDPMGKIRKRDLKTTFSAR